MGLVCDIGKCLSTHKVLVQRVALVVGGLVALRTVAGVIGMARARSATAARRAAQEKDLPYLFLMRVGGILGGGPGLKVEAFLRMHKLPYAVTYGMNNHISPTERLPCMELNGVAYAESEFLVQRLASHFGKPSSYADASQQATFVMLRRLCEDSMRLHLYRSMHVDNPETVLNDFRSFAPKVPVWILRAVYRRVFRQRVIDMLNQHGQGDLTNEQYESEFLRDVQTIETLLSKHKFVLTDDAPGLADVSLFGWLHVVRAWSRKSGIKPAAHWDFVRNSSVINAYVDRMVALLFPDAAELLAYKETTQRFKF